MSSRGSKEKIADFQIAFITIASIYIMGYINAYALNTRDLGLLVTPQTGNIIWMGINAASGNWRVFIDNLGLFFGFIIGAIFVIYTRTVFKNKSSQFYFDWSIFVIPTILYPLVLQFVVPSYVSLFILGFSSGVALGCFRQVYSLDINNAMATGNVRFIGVHFAGAVLKKNKKELFNLWIFFLCVFMFAAGAFCYTKFAQMDNYLCDTGKGYILGIADNNIDTVPCNIVRVIGLIVICLIPYFFYPQGTNLKEVKDEELSSS